MSILIGWQYKGKFQTTIWSHSESPEDLDSAQQLVEADNSELPPEDGRRVVILTGTTTKGETR